MSIGVQESIAYKPLNCGQFRHHVPQGNCKGLFSEKV